VLAKDVQHPRAHLGEVNRVDVGDLERLTVEANVNVGGVTRALLIGGTDLVDIGQIGIGTCLAEAKNKIGQRSTKALGKVMFVGCVCPVVEIYMFVDKDQYTKRSELSVGACYLVY